MRGILWKCLLIDFGIVWHWSSMVARNTQRCVGFNRHLLSHLFVKTLKKMILPFKCEKKNIKVVYNLFNLLRNLILALKDKRGVLPLSSCNLKDFICQNPQEKIFTFSFCKLKQILIFLIIKKSINFNANRYKCINFEKPSLEILFVIGRDFNFYLRKTCLLFLLPKKYILTLFIIDIEVLALRKRSLTI